MYLLNKEDYTIVLDSFPSIYNKKNIRRCITYYPVEYAYIYQQHLGNELANNELKLMTIDLQLHQPTVYGIPLVYFHRPTCEIDGTVNESSVQNVELFLESETNFFSQSATNCSVDEMET